MITAHKEELKEIKLATKVATDALREQLHKQGQNELRSLRDKHQNEMG